MEYNMGPADYLAAPTAVAPAATDTVGLGLVSHLDAAVALDYQRRLILDYSGWPGVKHPHQRLRPTARVQERPRYRPLQRQPCQASAADQSSPTSHQWYAV